MWLLESEKQGTVTLGSEARRLVRGALMYVLTQDDVIPDYAPALGYVDDAYVVNKCLIQILAGNPALSAYFTSSDAEH